MDTLDYIYKSVDEFCEALIKAWPKEYSRVKGQDKHKGTASKKQYRFMQAAAGGKVADISAADAKAYLANSSKGGDGLPDSGTGGKRGERERAVKHKHKKKEKDEAKKSDDDYIDYLKDINNPKKSTFDERVNQIKDKYREKKPKSFDEQVADVKQKYAKPLKKSRDLFYANIEGCLDSEVGSEELISNMIDMDLLFLNKNDELSMEGLYKHADRYFDTILTPEIQTVYELSYMAKGGCETSLHCLVEFIDEMQDELSKNIPLEVHVSEMVKNSVAKFKDKIKGGLADKKKPCDFDQEQLNAGIKVEMEHTDDKGIASEIAMDHLTENANYYKKLKVMEEGGSKDKKEASEDNSRVKGKSNGESYRMVHGYKRYTSGPKRGEYVHRHEAEKRLGRTLGSKEEVHHTDGNRSSTTATKVSSKSKHSAETNSKRAKSKNGYSGDHRVEHTGSH